MKHILAVFTALILPLSSLFSQNYFEEGSVVTISGDTLKGLIRNDLPEKLTLSIVFKKHKNATEHRYTPNDLKAFVISPNRYFEAHAVYQKETPTAAYTNNRYFLRRIETGYLSVFELNFYSKYTHFLKKQGDNKVYSMVMTIRPRNIKNNPPVDTLTNNRNSSFNEVSYVFGLEYLKTYNSLVSDWKDYNGTNKFVFHEDTIAKQVRAYNKAVHPNFQPKTLATRGRLKTVWTVAANFFTPTNTKGQFRREHLSTFKVREGQPWGYELAVGMQGKGNFKSLSFEAGFAKLASVYADFTFLFSGVTNINVKGTQLVNYQNVFARANYEVMSGKMLSPYVSFGYARSKVYVQSDEETLQPPIIKTSENIEGRGDELFFAAGARLALFNQHILRAEIDLSPTFFNRPYPNFIRLGYQYRFRL